MIFGLEQEPVDWKGDYGFKFKQPVVLENTNVYKSASESDLVGRFSGTYYVKNPKPIRGMIRVNAQKSECDVRFDDPYYVRAVDLIRIMKRNEHGKDL